MARNITSISLNSTTYDIRPYLVCSTAASTTAKAITSSNDSNAANFTLYDGATVIVKFTNGNSASAPTLNINSTGAKTIRCMGAALTDKNRAWAANSVLEFVYDSTYNSNAGCWYLMTTNNTDTDTDSDTLTTTGSSNKTATKLYLTGAESQATSATTYSNSNCYIGTDNCLYSNGSKVITSDSDTLNTAGSTNTNSTIYLVGTTSQASSAQTYSNSNCYASGGHLYSNGIQVVESNYRSTGLSTSTSASTYTLSPNVYYTMTPKANVKHTFAFGTAISNVMNEYVVEINCSNYAPTLAWPSSVVWVGGSAPVMASGKKYVISIVNNLGVFAEF